MTKLAAEKLASLESRKLQNLCLLVIAAACLGAMFYFLRGVLVPFTLALFLNVCIKPTVNYQVTKLKFPRALAVAVTLAISGLLLVLLAILVTNSSSQLLANVGAYEQRFQERLLATVEALPTEISSRLDVSGISRQASVTVGRGLTALGNGIIFILSQFTVVFLFLLFMLLGGHAAPQVGVLAKAEERTRSYLLIKTGLSALTGLAVGTVLSVAQVELALVFALLTFVLNFVPNVGSLVATLLPIPVLLFSPALSFSGALLVLVLIAAFQFLIGNILEPKVLGERLDLHPIAVLLSLLVWGAVWGAVGMLLGVPITAVLKIVLEQSEETRPLALALAGRFPGMVENPEQGEGDLSEQTPEQA